MKKRIQVMVEDELYNQIEKESKEFGLSLSSFIRLKLMEIPLVIEGDKLVTIIKRTENGRNKLD